MASVAGSGGGASAGAGGLKTYFKTPEGRHKLQYEKTHSPAVVHYNHNGKTVAQMTVAYLKEKPAGQGSTPSTPSAGSGMRSAAARLLGTGNGSRTLSFGSNGTSRAVSGSSRMGGGIGVSTSASGSQGMANYDGKGSYIIFNTADTLFISDLNSHDKATTMVQLKQKILFLCQCTCVAWVPEREGIFVVSHADGNLYVYDKFKDGNTDWTFPTVKDQSQVLISHAKSSKGNPIARWHICQGAINGISFSPDGAYLATVGRDGKFLCPRMRIDSFVRLVQFLLIRVGPNQIQMKLKKMSCIALGQLDSQVGSR
ncbi:Transducin/WD40 repeat-like superfamily protein [Zea mays]|uniref:Transducin/WD40 repeat-like superfamily protein n=1 Tax=Zea mays TaxID=4577 RepID=A0A1D6QLM4_MAIZE|nr:Transducin/WD40 repeat-like superfamily protein [Zea mays]